MASKRRLRRRGCKGKHPYENEDAANKAVWGLRKSFDQPDTWIAYKCPWCGKWHVGRPNRKKRRLDQAKLQARLASNAASLSEKQGE